MPASNPVQLPETPDPIQQGWIHFLSGDLDRAEHTLEVAERQARRSRDSALVRLHRKVLRGLQEAGPTQEDLALPWEDDPDRADPDQGLLSMSYYLRRLGEAGCPLSLRISLQRELVQLATLRSSPYRAPLRLQLARLWWLAGSLGRAREILLDLVEPGGPPGGTYRRARLLLRVVEIYQGRGGGLEGLSTLGLDNLQILEAKLVLARAHLRLGQPSRAEPLLWEAQRLGTRFRLQPALAAVSCLQAERELLRGLPGAARGHLEAARAATPRTGPGAWRLSLLRARARALRGEPGRARRLLSSVLPQLERLEEVAPLREARLLQLGLRLRGRTPPGVPELREEWERVQGWEDATDRWRFLALVLPRLQDPRLTAEMVRSLDRERRLGDPRGRWLDTLRLAREDWLAGDPERARKRLATLESPLGRDLPEGTLESWRELLVDPELCSRPDPEQALFLEELRSRRPPPVPEGADLFLDLPARMIWRQGERLDFRRKPMRLALLAFLARHRPRGFPVHELVEKVWERESIPYETDRLVYVGVHRLRQDLGHPDWVEEVDGHYRLSPRLRVELVEVATQEETGPDR